MIEYEQTEDIDFITRCLTDPCVWRMGSDDGMAGINPGLFFVRLENKIYLKTGLHGLLIGIPVNSIMLDVHVALLPSAKGKAAELCSGAINWVFNNTQYLRLIASIPEHNNLALKLARSVGMQFVGINSKSFMKNGCLLDQHIFGISKGDLCHQ
ncbi:MAG: GNAT family N-acetyltransferase [Nitrosomonas sp.]|nr:GNAT family N-acetyltransferase [Nitrosomonas sp.]